MSKNESYKLARCMIDLALEKKAHNIQLLDLSKLTSVVDYFIVCHGEADLHVKAIADSVQDGMRDQGEKAWHREGYDYLHWVLLDYVDVVIHVFQKEDREFYGLERLWGDAKIETFKEEV